MRLLKLSANDPRFRTVTFNRTGLSLVVSEQKTPKTEPDENVQRATLNKHDITPFSEHLEVPADELRRPFDSDNVVLRLSDDKPQNKLLGLDVDMNYFN